MLKSLTICAALVTAAPVFAEIAEPSGRVLLTIGGDVMLSNTAPHSPDSVNVSGFMDIGYDKGVAFDEAMLAALSQHEISAKILDNVGHVAYSGPLLSDILDMAGAEGGKIFASALDGYQAEIPIDLIEAHQPILATHANGMPLEIGKLGPAMIVFPEVADAELYDSFHAMEVFAMFYIEVE